MSMQQYPGLLQHLSLRLKEPLPAREALRMMFPNIKAMPESLPENVRLSAVMLLLYQENGNWFLLAIRRTEDGHAHSGQIGFPGGKQEPEDEDMMATALRETYEEIGIRPGQIQVIGAMSPVYVVVSNFNVFPFIGYIDTATEFDLNPEEVQALLKIPLEELFAPSGKTITEVVSPAFPDVRRKVNAYKVLEDVIIWGASAIMIAELQLLMQEKYITKSVSHEDI